MEEMIQLWGLTTGYAARQGGCSSVGGAFTASLPGGCVCSLLGPNGSGKSTLLKTLSGFLRPLGGAARIAGVDLGSATAEELSRSVGVVLTDRVTVEGLTVRSLVESGRSPHTGFWGRQHEADRRAVDEALALVGIGRLEARRIDTLSDGERQKALVAKALAQATPVILLDEPTAFLDFPSKVELMLMLGGLARERRLTVLLSTHDVEIALQTSDRLWLLHDRKLTDGTPAELARCGEISRCFSSPGVAFEADAMRFRISPPNRKGPEDYLRRNIT